MQKVCISISPGIPLRGDILIKCYHKKTRSGQREIIWRCQFHTCAISDYNLVFTKSELDEATTGKCCYCCTHIFDSNKHRRRKICSGESNYK